MDREPPQMDADERLRASRKLIAQAARESQLSRELRAQTDRTIERCRRYLALAAQTRSPVDISVKHEYL